MKKRMPEPDVQSHPKLGRDDLQDSLPGFGWRDLCAKNFGLWVVSRVGEFALKGLKCGDMRSVTGDGEQIFTLSEFDGYR